MKTRTLDTARHIAAEQRGFSFPELLVAMGLTVVVSALTFQALQGATRATEAVMAMSDVNQNLRVAMNVLIRDLMSTGEGIPTGGISFPTGGTKVRRPGPPGSLWNFDDLWSTLPSVSPGDDIGVHVNEVPTDVVTLLTTDRRLDLGGVFIGTTANNGSSIANDGSSITLPTTFDNSDPATQIAEGDLIMLSDSNGRSSIQEVTSVSGRVVNFASSATSYLNQPTAPEGSVVDLQNPAGDPVRWPPLTILRVKMISYYIYVPTEGQITSPHLIRRVNYGQERVVAIGVTNLQLTWDLVDGVDNPINVADPGPTAADPNNQNTEHQIRKANIFMAARSLDTQSQTGQFVYSSLTTNVSLRSMAFVSRYDVD